MTTPGGGEYEIPEERLQRAAFRSLAYHERGSRVFAVQEKDCLRGVHVRGPGVTAAVQTD